jgi:hypothetical protein
MLRLRTFTMSEQEIFLFPKKSRLNLVPTQPPVWQVLRTLFIEVKWLECEVDHLYPWVIKVKNEWSYDFTLSYAFIGFTGVTCVFIPCFSIIRYHQF